MENKKGSHEMTDRQYKSHLEELLKIAESSADLEEFKKALLEIIRKY